MTAIDPHSDEPIGHLHDRLEPDVWHPILGTSWQVKRLPSWPTPTTEQPEETQQ